MKSIINKISVSVCLMLAFVVLTMVNPSSAKEQANNDYNATYFDKKIIKKAKKRLKNMSLDEKLYQMFVVVPEDITKDSLITNVDDNFKQELKKYPVCGFTFLRKNFVDKTQTTKMLGDLAKYTKENTKVLPFLCSDEEGGRVVRIAKKDNAFGYKALPAMGSLSTPKEANEWGKYIGEYMREVGLNVDFAPVVDVLTNPENEVIGDRSFGADVNFVIDCSQELSNGLHSKGVLTSFKHFPGHGGTTTDTHQESAIIDKTLSEMRKVELKPYEMANKYADMVMLSHVISTKIDNDNPCTLSKKMVDILREDLKYKGIIITDAMMMGAVTKSYDSADATIKAVQAGADIILMPDDFHNDYAALKKAVLSGKISRQRINNSVLRILKAKYKMMNNMK